MHDIRRLPAVDRVLQQLPDLIDAHGRQLVTACVRAELAAAREGFQHGLPLPDEPGAHFRIEFPHAFNT